ncbi:hypothetical protein [Methanospirillum lacunae]|uniref:DUF4430 domain-containing protein n=1 Tax=Methanospirillum lacunae TaxID=668570 RepID=A0A2V2NFS9_9EURY|nr:hypothetical protein [Methanospirillum lacunae]PWR74163.1 hypothetical protein DK846_03140 [Methanospirillum lacunae]
MRFYSNLIFILVLLCICTITPIVALADGNLSSSASVSGKAEIFSGSIPSGEGVVSIKAVSGKLYQVPAMSPLGIIQALAGTDSIESYKVGDELITKRGILTLDGVNGYVNSGENSWFVLVNDKQLQDYLLPTEDGLNVFPLKTGDKVVFVFGNPTKSPQDATATIRVSIGALSDQASQIKTVAQISPQTTSVQATPTGTGTLTPVITPTITPSPTITTPSVVETKAPSTEPTQKSTISGKDPNLPVYGDDEEKSSVTTESPSSSRTSDPNQPVYEDKEGKSVVTSESTTSSPSNSMDLNKPVYEDSETKTNTTTKTTSSSKIKDPNQPVYGDEEISSDSTPEPTETPTLSENSSSSSSGRTNDTSNETEVSKSNTSHSGKNVLYDGSLKLPSGFVNVTAQSGEDYEVGADTPLGLLQYLANEKKISGMNVNDRGMRKGNILAIDSIGDFQYGDENWFCQVNDVTLQHFTNPGTDGLNTRKVKSGDKITFFYGKQDQDAASAKAIIYLTID